MLSEIELLSTLRLMCVPNIGEITAKKLLTECGSATQVFKEHKNTLSKIDGVGSFKLKDLHHTKYAKKAENELQFLQKNQINFFHFKDPSYPKLLKHCADSPLLLFSRGAINFEKGRFISIVGTRQITSYGIAFLEKFIDEIAALNVSIISGFAYGVDITAQTLAAKHNLQTIGCLAHGLNQIYPKAHKKYCEQIERKGGFITDFWSTSQPERENFLKRNRIIAGISQATIVVESAAKGGSLVTAELANGYHRDVFAVPGRSTDRYSEGCNRLIQQQKAQMITSAADLIYHLGWNIETETSNSSSVQKQLFVDLDEVEKSIYLYLQLNGKQLLDTVALGCNLPIFKTSSTLLGLEMKGVVRPLPGKMFEAI